MMTLIPTIEMSADPHGALLNEIDDLIAALNGALSDQASARLVIADAESEQAIIEASLTLTIEGRNEAERRARLLLALRDDAVYQELGRTLRYARAALWQAERTFTVTKHRLRLVHAAMSVAAETTGLER